MSSSRYLAIALVVAIVALSGVNYYTYSLTSSEESQLQTQLTQAKQTISSQSSQIINMQKSLSTLEGDLAPYYMMVVTNMTKPPQGSPSYSAMWSVTVMALSGLSFGSTSEIIIRGELFTAYDQTLVGSINLGTFSVTSYNNATTLGFNWNDPSTGTIIYTFPEGQYVATFQPLDCGTGPTYGPSCVNAGPPLRVGTFTL